MKQFIFRVLRYIECPNKTGNVWKYRLCIWDSSHSQNCIHNWNHKILCLKFHGMKGMLFKLGLCISVLGYYQMNGDWLQLWALFSFCIYKDIVGSTWKLKTTAHHTTDMWIHNDDFEYQVSTSSLLWWNLGRFPIYMYWDSLGHA